MSVFILLVVLLDVFVIVSLRARMDDTLQEVLAARVQLVRELDAVYEGAELVERLGARAVPAIVTTPDGESIETGAIPRFDVSVPAAPDPDGPRESRVVALGDGGTAEVFVNRGGADSTLRRVVLIAMLGTAVAIVVALLLFRRAAAVAIAPLDQVVAAAKRTAAGHSGERLAPDDPTTDLGHFAAAYDAMLDALEDALETTRHGEERTRRFVDDAAHQLRTPLATVRAATEALLRESRPEVRDELMAALVREVARADRLITSMLTLARFDGEGRSATAPTDLVALLRDEVERCQSLAPHLEITLDDADAPATPVMADAAGLREVLANLLDNARRHATDHIEVAITAPDGHVEIRVADDGPGLDPADGERAFDRFTTLDGRGGSGLGLAIGRSIAHRHGGTLTYDSGAFGLRFPAAPVHDPVGDAQP